ERIAATLESEGIPAIVERASNVASIEGYDAVVLGSAAYFGRWLKDARAFAARHREALVARPVWLFSSGPVGHKRVDKQGRDLLEVSRPKEFEELRAALQPRGEQVFFGSWDPKAPPVGFIERIQSLLPASWTGGMAGDFRDWPAVDAWAAEIANELKKMTAQAS